MKISKQDALTWFRFFAELPEDEDLLPHQQEIAWAVFSQIEEAVDDRFRRLKAQNVFVYCADMDGRPAFQQNLTGPIALVAGSEGSGVSPLVKSLCDGVLSLPMAGGGTGGGRLYRHGGGQFQRVGRHRHYSV